MTTFYYIIFLIIISIYGVLASSEVGMALATLYPRLSNSKSINRYTYRPIWEMVNIFLIFAAVMFLTIFNKPFLDISRAVLIPLFFAMFGILLRPIIGNYVSYQKTKASRWSLWTLTVSSYLTPFSIAGIGIYYFTGRSVLSTGVGFILLISALLGITTIGLAFVNRDRATIKANFKYWLYFLFGFWAIDLGFMLPSSLISQDSRLLRAPLTILTMVLAVSVVSYFLYSAMKNKLHELYQYTILVGFIVPVLLGIDLMPYAISSTTTINHVNGVVTNHISVWLGLIICLPIILTSSYILYRIFLNDKKSRD